MKVKEYIKKVEEDDSCGIISYIAIGCWLVLTIGNMISKKYAVAGVSGMMLIFSTLLMILNTLQELA